VPIIESYFAERKIRKLHIGCGGNILSDWLNSDFFPDSNAILHLNATDTFPFSHNTFDYVFSEHMIEHISYSNALSMLSECHRVLKNIGKIRISTPDLQFLIDLYRDDKSELQRQYIKWATDERIKSAPYYDDTFVINSFVRDWGHLFIYDEKTLRSSLEKAGFTQIVRCDLSESKDGALRNLENEKRMPKGFLKLESLTLEGTKVLDS
jgi:predicted SAM-dependent methyltransferase